MHEIPHMNLGRIAYERWREATGIPLEFAWARLPHVTQAVWEEVAQAVLTFGVPDTEEGAEKEDVCPKKERRSENASGSSI